MKSYRQISYFFIYLLLLVCSSKESFAASRDMVMQEFVCEETKVKVYLDNICKGSDNFYRARKIVLSTMNRNQKYQIVFDGNYYVGANCQISSNHKSLVLFQAYCDGSDVSCYPDKNFGIIDPKSLKVLLHPNSSLQNNQKALNILGYKPKFIEVISSRQLFKFSTSEVDYAACS